MMGWKGLYRLRQASFCLCYGVYLVMGALVFTALEAPNEIQITDELRQKRSEFLANNPCVDDESLEEFLKHVVQANERGISASNNVTFEPNWSIGQAIFFAATVVTTIGYGHSTPLTNGGRAFCLFFALLGIPLTIILFAVLSHWFTPLLRRARAILTSLLTSRLPQRWPISKEAAQRFGTAIHLITIVIVLLVFIFCIPAAILARVEPNWDYLGAFYYVAISLTTVGLGDYIPGDSTEQPNRALYKICVTVYLYVGLAALFLTVQAVKDVPELDITRYLYNSEDGSEDGEEDALLGVGTDMSSSGSLSPTGSSTIKLSSTASSTSEGTLTPSTPNGYKFN